MNIMDLTCSEIKSLVDSGALDLDSLSKEELETICDKETNELFRDESHDITLLNTCSRILSKFDGKEFEHFWNKDIDIGEINKKLTEHPESAPASKKHKHMPLSKKIVIIAAAALIAAVFITSVIAVFDPFAKYGFSVKDIKGMKSGIIEGDGYEVRILKETRNYNSFDELFAAENISILTPSGSITENVNYITYSVYNDYVVIHIDVDLNNGSHVHYSVNFGDQLPPECDEALFEDDIYRKSDWHGYNLYYIEYDDTAHADIFVDGYVYEISTDTRGSIDLLLNNLE